METFIDTNKLYSLTVTGAEAAVIFAGIKKMPFEVAVDLVNKVLAQINEQNKPENPENGKLEP